MVGAVKTGTTCETDALATNAILKASSGTLMNAAGYTGEWLYENVHKDVDERLLREIAMRCVFWRGTTVFFVSTPQGFEICP